MNNIQIERVKALKLKKDAVAALPLALLSVIFYSLFYESLWTLLLLTLPISYLMFNLNKRIRLTRNFIFIVILMGLGTGFLFFSYADPLLIPLIKQNNVGSYSDNSLFTAAICFLVYIVGYMYGYKCKLPFNILGYIFLYQLILVIVYLSMVYGFLTYNLLYGVIIIATLPYIFLILSNMGNKWIIIFSILLSLYFILIGSRTAFGGVILFSLTYYLYPYLTRTNFIYNLFFIVCFFGFISLQFLYVQGVFNFVDDFMLQVFNKNIDSGRIDIWKNLSVYILEKPFFGYGSNQSSSYISSDFIVNSSNEPRSLSSHNMYLEILLRGGIFLLGIMSLIFYLLWKTLYSFNNFIYPRIAAAGFISFIFLAGGVEIGLTQNIIVNSLLWGFWGMAGGNNLSDNL